MVNLDILISLAQNELIKHLQYFGGEKDLIIDSRFLKFIERIVGFSFLKTHGINKIYKLETLEFSKSSQLVILIPPVISIFEDILSKFVNILIEYIKKDQEQEIMKNYIILFFPSRPFSIDVILEKECLISDNILLDNLKFNFIPLDADLLSLEQNFYFRELYIEKSNYPMEYITECILILMRLYGFIPLIYSVGSTSIEMADFIKYQMSFGEFSFQNIPPEIGRLIIFDRTMDKISPMLSQLCYEGMLSEEFKINSGFLEVNSPEVLSKFPIFKNKILLNDKTEIYSEIRDSYIGDVFASLKTKLNELKVSKEKSKDITSVTRMKEFVSNDLRLITEKRNLLLMHISLGEVLLDIKNLQNFADRLFYETNILKRTQQKEVVNYIENLIITQESFEKCLKIIILWYMICDPSLKNFQHIKDCFIKSFGYIHILTFERLENAGFLKTFTPSFEKVNKYFNLVIDETSSDLLDSGITYGKKFKPLSCEIIKNILFLNQGQYMNTFYTQHNYNEICLVPFNNLTKDAQKTVMILFLGGVTHTEISYLRNFAKQSDLKIIISTTCIINGTDLITNFI